MEKLLPEQVPTGPSVEVVCRDENEIGLKIIELRIRNDIPSTVHIFDSPKMPYRIMEDDKTLLILHGVNPPDPDKFYYGIEIPLTCPLNPGEKVSFSVNTNPLFISDHYETRREPTALHNQITVIGRVGWGMSPIVAADRPRMSIQNLMDWQSFSSSVPITLDFE